MRISTEWRAVSVLVGFSLVLGLLGPVFSFNLLAPSPAEAADTLFSDGFEDNDDDFPNWDSADPKWKTVDNAVAAHSGDIRAEVNGNTSGDDILLKSESTEGYDNIDLTYWYRVESFEEDDDVYVEWFDGD